MISMNLNDCRQKTATVPKSPPRWHAATSNRRKPRLITGLLISTGRWCCLEVLTIARKSAGEEMSDPVNHPKHYTSHQAVLSASGDGAYGI